MLQYIFLAFLTLLGAFFIYKIALPVNSPDFGFRSGLSEDKLNMRVSELASESGKTSSKGRGLSLKKIRRKIIRGYRQISKKLHFGIECFEFENWIYDNFYKIDERMNSLNRELHKLNFLPHNNAYPRIYELAELIVKSCDGYVNDNIIKGAVEAYNNQSPLLYSEIVALKSVIEYVLIEYISIFCDRSISIGRNVKHAQRDAKDKKIDLSYIRFNSYTYSLYKLSDSTTKRKLAELCLNNGADINVRNDNFFALTAKYNGQIQSAITTLHKLSTIFDDDFVIKLSPVYEILSQEQGIYFNEITLASKYSYLASIHRLAKKQGLSETALTRHIIEKSLREKKDISFEILPKKLGKKTMYFYMLSTLLVSVFSGIFLCAFLPKHRLIFFIICIPIFLTLGSIFISSTTKSLIRRRELPSSDLKALPAYNTLTLITVARLICTESEIEDAFKNLETIICANNDSFFKYALLLDLPASRENILSENDKKIMEKCKEYYEKSAYKDRLNVFLRARKKASGENIYQGWDKKRGAILQLNELLLTGNEDDFYMVLGQVPSIQYVITLDSDTLTNSCRQLVELMEHPYNRSTTIISINMKSHSLDAFSTAYSKLFSGSVGLNGYSNYIADSENDLFGAGNYTGKGIYRVKEFNEKIKDSFQEGRILSHDYIEGAYAECANSCEYALDCFPQSFPLFLARQLRWLRGDWQLLPFLWFKVKNSRGIKGKNPITPINKWHIFMNLIYSLVPISMLLALYIATMHQSPSQGIIIALILPLTYFLISIRSSILNKHFAFLSELIRQVFNIIMLPIIAFYNLASIIITIYRLIVKKKLLEWKVFAHSGGKINYIPSLIASAIFIISTIFFSQNVFFYVLGGMFLLSLPVVRLTSRVTREKRYFSNRLSVQLMEIARRTYGYFDEALGDSSNALGGDNFQYYSNVGLAYRTSPTNIGFMLISHICAYELGFIDEKALNVRLEKIISAVEKCPKWHGNLYNWIDTKTLTPLKPMYVSSVDSGNFLMSLVLVNAYLSGELRQRVTNLINQTDISKLFDKRRGLFLIGYNDCLGVYDSNHYDLVSSEALITYLVAIGLGKISKTAFFNLSKQAVKYKNRTLFYSWTGGMFEYLMCPLFFDYNKNTIFDISEKNAILSQIAFAKKHKMPAWGISESQYYSFNENNDYRYKAFGVPNTALSQNPFYKVVSPYSTFLALSKQPKICEKNIFALEKLGLYGKYGFFEAIDLNKGKVIESYMTHHQGMILTAICNFLCDNAIIKRMQAHASIRAAELLLSQCEMPKGRKKVRLKTRKTKNLPEQLKLSSRHTIPYANFLALGKYCMVNDENGGGYSCYDNIMLTRNSGQNCSQELLAVINGKKSSLLDGEFTIGFDSSLYELNCERFYSRTEIMPIPSGNGEVRMVEFINTSQKPFKVKFLSKLEVVLTDKNADIAHRAYSNMFVETHVNSDENFVYAKRTNSKKELFLAHFVYCKDVKKIGFETDRRNYYERGKYTKNSVYTLDPILSANLEMTLMPKQKVAFSVFTLVAHTNEAMLNAVKLTKIEGFAERAKGSNFALMSYNNMSLATKKAGAKLLYGSAMSIKEPFLKDRINIRKPIIALIIKSENGLNRLKNKLLQLQKLFAFGIEFNIAIIYSEKHNYFLHMNESLNRLLDELSFKKSINSGSAVLLVNENEDKYFANLLKENSVDIDSVEFEQKKEIEKNDKRSKKKFKNVQMMPLEYSKQLGVGGFLSDYSYAMDLSHLDTPAAWSNIISNGNIGTIITESGGGYTFFDNSREHKITCWSNDTILDPPSEYIALSENDLLWSITKKPFKTESNYQCIHGLGFSEFKNNFNGILSTQTQFIHKDLPIKFFAVNIENTQESERELTVFFALKLVLGDFYQNTACSTDVSKKGNIVCATNNANAVTAYIGSSKRIHELYLNPPFLIGSENSCSAVCPAISVRLNLAGGEKTTVVFSIGGEEYVDYSAIDLALEAAKKHYSSLSKINIDGFEDMAIMSKWLPYQIYCSRFLSRAGFYQAGGAIGFRDQLQDSLSILYIDSKKVKNHILESAAHQFEDGDVQHWWHPPAVGVRTKISDDRLFLPLVVAEYIEFTHDFDIMAERVPFLKNIEIPEGAESVYYPAKSTQRSYDILEHCLRAIKYSLRFGENGLVLMEGGDWNDAMDKVGKDGKGTSVWGSMFLFYVIKRFLPYINEQKIKSDLLNTCSLLKDAINNCFNGEWFLRAYTDEGKAIGSPENPECKIDLLTQSWSVLCGACDEKTYNSAIYSAINQLVSPKDKIIRLLTPPFKETKNIGYIADYPKGVRENGGQYTHAAVWFIISLIRAGKIDTAWQMFSMICPINHSKTVDEAELYRVEPYVITADIYDGDYTGRGGWSWYTGAASWYYKCLIEEFLGVKINGSKLSIQPNLPNSVSIIPIKLATNFGELDITIDNSGTGKWRFIIGHMVYNGQGLNITESLIGKKITVKRQN